MFEILLEVINLFEYAFLIKLLVAAALAGVIGFEREKDLQPAGLRTHMIVALASSLVVSIAIISFSSDSVSRVVQGIVAGIGFLGAGTIISHGEWVKGLTTAATVWAVAGIGVVVGFGLFFEAIVATVVLFGILQLKFLDEWIHAKAVKAAKKARK